VPATSIVKFSHRSANTREEAGALDGFVAIHGWKRVLVVTSNYHARRAHFIFGRVFRPGVTVRVSAAPDSEFDPSRWWETRLGEKLFFNEVIGYVVAWWELRSKSSAARGATLLAITPAPLLSKPPLVDASRRPVPPVSFWKQTRFRGTRQFTRINPYTIVRSLPSSPGCFVIPPGPVATEFRLGGIHVA
jgi:hypothetical protein